MKSLEQATTRELELAQVKLAIARTNVDICRMENDLTIMRNKQIARHKEVARQEATGVQTAQADAWTACWNALYRINRRQSTAQWEHNKP